MAKPSKQPSGSRTSGKTADSNVETGEMKMRSGEMPAGQMTGENADADMPRGSMDAGSDHGKMPGGGMESGSGSGSDMPSGRMAEPSGAGGPGAGATERVLVELRVQRGGGPESTLSAARALSVPSFAVDPDFEPVPMRSAGGPGPELAAEEETVVVRASVDPGRIAELEADPNVVKVWKDGRIAPFADLAEERGEFRYLADDGRAAPSLELRPDMAACPIGTCDCDSGTPKGAIADVANYLGVNQIWSAGLRGEGIVVGVVDGGIRAAGRTIKPGESGRTIGRVIGGWPTASWGTTAAAWGDHGNMCATDVLGMAPNAQIYDLRISDGEALSDALQAFQWAINQHRANGTPQILTNSWGMYQKAWDPDYCTNPNHPFTRKVVEAIDEGILVLFAAGNCGATCPSGRCGSDNGPGKSIWGANGHPRVMTVGAVNRNEQFVGYSSQGPAALDANKPDFCSVTHFTGYFTSDSGTSAATPIAAGVTALLKQSNLAATQDQEGDLQEHRQGYRTRRLRPAFRGWHHSSEGSF